MKMINESGITTFVFPIDTAVHVGSNSSKLYNSQCILITGLSSLLNDKQKNTNSLKRVAGYNLLSLYWVLVDNSTACTKKACGVLLSVHIYRGLSYLSIKGVRFKIVTLYTTSSHWISFNCSVVSCRSSK